MDTYESEGFFPEREVLRARRLRAMADVPVEPSDARNRDARNRRVASWVTASVAVITPIFATAIVFGWIPLRLSLEVTLCAISCLFGVAGALAAVNLRGCFPRATSASS